MVARRFVVRQASAGEEHEVEYDTDDGLDVLRFQIFSLTSVPPDLQKIVVEADGSVVDDGTGLESIPDGLCLVSIDEGEDADAASASATAQEKSDEELKRLIEIEVEADGSVVDDVTDLKSISEVTRLVPIGEGDDVDAAAAAAMRAQEKSDEELTRMIQAEEEALLLQKYSIQSDRGEVFRERVEPYMRQVLKYEDSVHQEAALKTVPVDELKEKALISLAKEGTFSPSKNEEDHAFLLELLFWFKQSFRWVNAAACDICDRETSMIGMGNPLPAEIEFGASRVEIYRCNHCSSIIRFPRYNDPHKLIQTRKGRCGEWANCFTFYCRVFGYEARLILDFTDHVWTECFSNLYGRWIHFDPCEGVYDNPLLYEKGWNKKLDYAIGISKDGVHDVTKRYTRKWHEVLSRRTITSEDTVSAILMNITTKCRSGLSSDELLALENRDRKESKELSKAIYLEINNSISLPGRQSGSVEWRTARVCPKIWKSFQATAAFDGIRLSKWEEPDGAKGCWLMYKVRDGQTCELESYDLMSANDAPERDPMDWVLEGSTGQGSTWNTIDARSSVIFSSRFCRKSFTVDKRRKANVLRFRFLRVRESSANPRFQIGSIDFYGKNHMA
ncbi:peptide-N(4)-(N-acetyl-beta-glucosaminyl)asparagine amidase isoform X2 [Hordeum vulgare subsp. vulgare]|uniref:peptide-N(4)-(N-acetyl-beta- glucosaminyl)asparagine amidase isoform X2 n=1 Tax=Hordeum vulgare subsp. vulgare TaxID=112509 RepID=UPI001D1A4400|nr:peptide-N(4)-(N-acetyl-beta-glucosaminyl)asparagine amidase isoform X2 [Hordeum vulgare subsp. vulgare]